MEDWSWLQSLMQSHWERLGRRRAVALLVSDRLVCVKAQARSGILAASASPGVKDALDSPMVCSRGTRFLQQLRLLWSFDCMCGTMEVALVVPDVLRSAASNQLPPSCRVVTQRTFIARRSSSISAGRAALMSGAAGKPTYLATPDKIETSRLYAVCCRI